MSAFQWFEPFSAQRIPGARMCMCLALALLAACGDNSAGSGGGRVTYSVSGNIVNLTSDGLILELNGADDLQVTAASNSFVFSAGLTDGASYAVTVKQNPSTQSCQVGTGAQGTVSGQNVANIPIVCSALHFTVGGGISGLQGTGLILRDQNTGAQASPDPGAGSYTLGQGFTSGTSYNVVAQNPTNPSQSCLVSNPSAAVADANVTNVNVACTTNAYSLGGTVTGLQGNGLTISDTVSGQILPIQQTGTGPLNFAFQNNVNSGSGYDVTVTAQPTGLNQTCSVQGGNTSQGAAPVGSGPVTTIAINCVTNLYGVSGIISGPAAASVANLRLFDDLNGVQAQITGTTFTFPYPNGGLPDGSRFHISIEQVETPYTNATIHCMPTASGVAGVLSGGPDTGVTVSCNFVSPGLAGLSSTTLAYVPVDSVTGTTAGAQTITVPSSSTLISGPSVHNGGYSAIDNRPLTTSTVYVGDDSTATIDVYSFTESQFPAPYPTSPSYTVALAQSASVLAYNIATLAADPLADHLYVAYSPTVDLSRFSIAANGQLGAREDDTLPSQNPGLNQNIVFDATGDHAVVLREDTKIPYGVGDTGGFTVLATPPGGGSVTAQDGTDTLPTTSTTVVGWPQAGVLTDKNLYITPLLGINFAKGSLPVAPQIFSYALNGSGASFSSLPSSPLAENIPADYAGPLLTDAPYYSYLFAVNQSAGIDAYQINADGSLTLAAGSPFRADGVLGVQSAVLDPSSRFLYAFGSGTGNIAAYAINRVPTTGQTLLTLTGVYSTQAGTGNGILLTDTAGKFLWALTNGSSLTTFLIDANTGALTLVGEGTQSYFSSGIAVLSAPTQ